MSRVLFRPRATSDFDVRGRDLERGSEFCAGWWKLWVRRKLHVRRALTPAPKTVDDLPEASLPVERVSTKQ